VIEFKEVKGLRSSLNSEAVVRNQCG